MNDARRARVVDLRSDTVTKPSPAMRRAMANAEVGDDLLDGDPTTQRLEAELATLLGLEAALFFPSGVQANQTAIWLHTDPGTELLVERDAHLVHYEMAALAALAGVQIRPVTAPDGVLTAALATAALRPSAWYLPRISAMAVENTHNLAGGTVMPLRVWDELVAFADAHGLPLHLDGARVWNAAAALGVPPARVVRGATTVMVSLSKGLGCPVGSCLLGPHSLMEGARVVRRRLGGAMRQTGILAAAGLHALAHNLQRLADDHAHAALLAERLREHPVLRPVTPQTNIVVIDLEPTGITADAAVDRLAEQGVLLVALGDTTLRAVTHLDLARDDVAYAAEIIAVTLAS